MVFNIYNYIMQTIFDIFLAGIHFEKYQKLHK